MKKGLLNQAVHLRENGHSFNEISKSLGISKSTASIWVRRIPVKHFALARLKQRELVGRKRGLLVNQANKALFNQEIKKSVKLNLQKIAPSKVLDKLFCSLFYWCEGEKTTNLLAFTNSDYTLIRTFLRLLRSGFSIDEKKLRVCMHLHSYHNEQKQKKFWSKITGIPISQFMKAYQKKNTGLTKKEGYQGCVSIRYYDHKVAKEVAYFWQLYANNGGLV